MHKTLFTILFTMGISLGCIAQDTGVVAPVFHKGRKFTIVPHHLDSIPILDPVTGSEFLIERVSYAHPISMNGKVIYTNDQVTTPAKFIIKKETASFEEYYLSRLTDEWKNLPDGIYRIALGSIVVDEKGGIRYHEIGAMTKIEYNKQDTTALYPRALGKDTIAMFNKKTCEILCNARIMQPAITNGKKVTAFYNDNIWDYKISVKNNTVSIDKSELPVTISSIRGTDTRR